MRDRSLCYSLALSTMVFLSAAVATAQDPEGAAAPPPPAGKQAPRVDPGLLPTPAADSPVAPAVTVQNAKGEASRDEAPRYGRVLGKEVRVLCFASQRSPAYEDVLREGDVVIVGSESGEFVEVVLPLGVVGYVHQDFTTQPADGVITTTRPRVSFRYRPKAGEAPTQLLGQGTPMRYLASEGRWWKVRLVPESAWLPIKEVQVFQGATPTLVKAYDALRKLQAEQCARSAAEFAKAAADARLRKEQELRLEELRKQVQEAADLPDKEQLDRLTELSASVEELRKEIVKEAAPEELKEPKEPEQPTELREPEEADEPKAGQDAKHSPLEVSLDLLAAQIKNQRLAAAARRLLEEKPKPASDVAPAPRLGGGFTRFVATGWLHFDRGAPGQLACRLEKGKKTVAYLTCTSGRYDLELFDGVEVGVRGSKALPGQLTWTAPVIDAVRLEVLSVPLD